MKHLRKFETLENYTLEKFNIEIPWVVLVTNSEKVYYSNDSNLIPHDEIWYISHDGNSINYKTTIETLSLYYPTSYKGPKILSETYDLDKQVWIIKFNTPITKLSSDNRVLPPIGDSMFVSYSDLNINIGNNLKEIFLPDSITELGYGSFFKSKLEKIIIPNSVTSIGDYAFQNCSILASVNIPNSVTSIGSYAFLGCSDLTSLIVESGNTKYDSRDNCNAIIETKTNTLILGCCNTIIPNSVTTIENSAFYKRSGLTSVSIPNSVTSIDSYAFYGCTDLTSVTIPDSVMSIGDHAFHGCNLKDENGIYYGGKWLLLAKDDLVVAKIKDGTVGIAGGAFSDCTSLTSVTIPNSVTSIGDDAFYHCNSLTSVTIPNSVTSIGDDAFLNCFKLTSITIPNSVTSIGEGAFDSCSRLTSVNYTGTKAQWNAITKWKYQVPTTCIVHCTDGDIAI